MPSWYTDKKLRRTSNEEDKENVGFVVAGLLAVLQGWCMLKNWQMELLKEILMDNEIEELTEIEESFRIRRGFD